MMPSRPWPRIVRGRTIVTSTPSGRGFTTQQLGLQLRPAVRFERTGRRLFGHGIVFRDAEDRTRRRVYDLVDVGITRGDEQVGRPGDVDGIEQVGILGERDLGDVVQHDIHIGTRGADDRSITDVAGHVLDCNVGFGRIEIEHAHCVAGGPRLASQHRSEVAAPARDEDPATHQIGRPRSRHHRIEARMPSSSATLGS